MTKSRPTGQVLSPRCAAQKHASRPQGRIATVPHCCLQQPAGHLSSKRHLLSPHRVISTAQPQPSRFAHQPAPGPTANGSPARATASPRPWLRLRPATHGLPSPTVSLTSSLPHACSPPPARPPPAPSAPGPGHARRQATHRRCARPGCASSTASAAPSATGASAACRRRCAAAS